MLINRREFLKGAAGISVAAAAATTVWHLNKSPEEMETLLENASSTDGDVLVIGGGIAGVMAAIRAKRAGSSVILVDKGSVGRSGQTPFASGFMVFDESSGDTREQWHQDMNTITGGIHHSAYLDNLMDYSKEIYDEMVEWGATEVGFGKVFRSKVMDEGVEVVERTMLTNLLEKDGQVLGAVGFNLDTGEALVVKTKAVILATGAGAFKPNGFQVCSLTSDGDAMAYRIGGRISGKEFMDTHMSEVDNPGYCWGTNESEWSKGIPSATGPEVNGVGLDLSMYHQVHEGQVPPTMSMPGGEGMGPPEGMEPPEGGEPGEGMTPPDGAEGGEGMSPTEGMEGMSGDGPPGPTGDVVGGASAGLGVHKCEGLFPADDRCGTNIKGLYAAGDCLSTMLAGTQYKGVGGIALAGSATQGALAGKVASEYATTVELPEISDEEVASIETEMLAPRNLEQGYDPAWVTQMLKFNTIPYQILFIKQEDRLQAALNNIMFFKAQFADKMIASDAHELRLVHETRNMLLNAEMKLRASLFRTESRGNHYREDYPDQKDEDWLAWVVLEKGTDGDMALSKVMVNA